MPRFNIIILLFSLFISFFVSYETKKYKLETYFGNNTKNYYQIENMYIFKKDNMIFDYAGSEQFKLIIFTNNLDLAIKDTDKFINELNYQMRKECRELKNFDKLDEFSSGCKNNRVMKSKQNIYENNRIHYTKLIIIFLNLSIILFLLKAIYFNLKKKAN